MVPWHGRPRRVGFGRAGARRYVEPLSQDAESVSAGDGPAAVITRIEAHAYRCFPALDVDLDRYHVLAGANGAGKTTLLDIPVLIGDMLRRQRVVGAFLERQ